MYNYGEPMYVSVEFTGSNADYLAYMEELAQETRFFVIITEDGNFMLASGLKTEDGMVYTNLPTGQMIDESIKENNGIK